MAQDPFAMNQRRSRTAFILLVVTVVIVMITLVGLSFVVTLSTENKAVHLQGDQLQLEQTLASGVELLRAVSRSSPDEQRQGGGVEFNASLFQDRTLTADEPAADGAFFRIVSPQITGDTVAGWRFGVEDESARLNLATLLDWERQESGAATRALLNLPGMTEAVADAILDWIDTDATPRPAGAEADYYASRGLPYEPRNGVPAVLEELLLVRDVSRQQLFGAETASADRAKDALPWALLLTGYSAERNTSAEGRPRIHLNQRELAKLHGQLREVFDPEWADFIIAFRQYGPAEPAAGAGPPPGFPASPPPFPPPSGEPAARKPPPDHAAGQPPPPGESPAHRLPPGRAEQRPAIDLTVPATHELTSILDVVGVSVSLPRKADANAAGSAGAEPIIWPSPLENQPDWLRAELPRLLDLTTTTEQTVLRGRINVRQAPRCVLLGIPGMDPALVDRIVAVRHTVSGGAQAADRHALWLLHEGLVDLARMKTLLPYITGGGDVVRAQVVARHERSRLKARAEVVIDATATPPRQVYYKDLSWLSQNAEPEAEGSAEGE
jgi:hypothetical protein